MASFEEWKAATGDTAGRLLPSGLAVEPLYREAGDSAPLLPAKKPMGITMEYDHWDWDTVVTQIHGELGEVDEDCAWIRLDRATRLGATHGFMDVDHVGRDGAVIAEARDLVALLDGRGPSAHFLLDAGANALPVSAMLRAASNAAEVTEPWDYLVTSDPLGSWAKDGYLPASLNDLYLEARDAGASLLVSTLPYHDAGCSPVQEVAFALASAIDCARAFESDTDYWSGADLLFRVAVTPDIFTEVAKLRALQWAWWRLYAELGRRPEAGFNAVGSLRTYSVREPWVNQLRSTAAGLAAQIGGAHTFCPRPYDALTGEGSGVGRRVARNTAIMMTAESHVGRVADAAAGSGLIESLSESIARDAWAMVQSIEKRGGMASALASGWVRAEIDREWAALCERYEQDGALVGVNEFRSDDKPLVLGTCEPDVEAIAARFGEPREGLELRSFADALAAAEDGATVDDLSSALVRGVVSAIEPMPDRRIAAELDWEGAAS